MTAPAQITFWPEGRIQCEFTNVTIESAGNPLWPTATA